MMWNDTKQANIKSLYSNLYSGNYTDVFPNTQDWG